MAPKNDGMTSNHKNNEIFSCNTFFVHAFKPKSENVSDLFTSLEMYIYLSPIKTSSAAENFSLKTSE